MPSILSFEENIRKISSKFSEEDDENNYVIVIEGESNLNKFNTILKEYGLDFVVRHSYSNRREKNNCAKRLLWQMKEIQPQNEPFVVDDIIRKNCVLGPHKSHKTNNSIDDNGHPRGKKRRFRLQPSKKISCPAALKIIVTVTTCYSQYAVADNIFLLVLFQNYYFRI